MNGSEPPDVVRRKEDVAGLFDRAATLYDCVGPRVYAHFGHRLVGLAQVPRGARVLDVATGTGSILIPAAEAVGPLGHVTGIDLSAAMVQQIAGEIARRHLQTAEVRQMDAEYLRFADESFDFVLCGFAMYFMPQLEHALGEMRRVLRPGGRIATTTWDMSFEGDWAWFRELVTQELPREPTPPAPVAQSPWSSTLETPEGLEGLMQRAGFIDVQVLLETAEFTYASEGEWWASLWSHGKREALEKVEEAAGEEGLNRLQAAVFRGLQTIRQPDGIHQRFPVLFTVAIKP